MSCSVCKGGMVSGAAISMDGTVLAGQALPCPGCGELQMRNQDEAAAEPALFLAMSQAAIKFMRTTPDIKDDGSCFMDKEQLGLLKDMLMTVETYCRLVQKNVESGSPNSGMARQLRRAGLTLETAIQSFIGVEMFEPGRSCPARNPCARHGCAAEHCRCGKEKYIH